MNRSDIGSGRLGLLWLETRPDRNRVWLLETQLDMKNRVGFLGLGSGLELDLWADEFVRILGLICWAYSLLLLTLKSYLKPLVLVKWLPTVDPTQFLGPTIATGKLNSSLTFQCTCPLAFSFSLSNGYYLDPLNSSLFHKRLLSVHTLSHGSGSSPFPFKMERFQYTIRIFLKMINGKKCATSFKMLTHT